MLTGDPEGQAASVAADAEEHSQGCASSSQGRAEDDSGEQKRGFSNSTSGRWASSDSWGDWDHQWDEEYHWKGQWGRQLARLALGMDRVVERLRRPARRLRPRRRRSWRVGSRPLGHGARNKMDEAIGAAAAGENLFGAETVAEPTELRRQMVEMALVESTTDRTDIVIRQLFGVDGSTSPTMTGAIRAINHKGMLPPEHTAGILLAQLRLLRIIGCHQRTLDHMWAYRRTMC